VPPVSGDAKTLERALRALVDNAIKFSPKGGDVEIRLSATGDKVMVAVEDHGIGIAQENMPRIFNRFFHLDKQENDLFGGVGLGLAITRQVIEQHQGSLDVTSEPGKGSVFTVTLKKS
jgi:two-component system phosphate regulon sensor histidine kinase PhoR